MASKRLYRSNEDKILAGICGGIGEYFDIDPIWIRLGAVLLVLMNGIGILLYLIAWILIPENPAHKKPAKIVKKVSEDKHPKKVKSKKSHPGLIVGIAFIAVGAFFLIRQFIGWFDFVYLWASLMIILGLYLIFRRK